MVITIVWLAIWEGISLLVGKELLFPSPIAVFLKLIQLAGTGVFWGNVGSSILRIVIGYACAAAAGTIVGVVTALVGWLDEFLAPIAKIIRATPVASFIMLLFVFAAKDNIPAVTAFLIVLPIFWANVYEGIKGTDKKLLEMAKVFRLPFSVVLKKIYIPSIAPFFMAAVKAGMGMAWKAGIAAEVLVNPRFGIGTALHDSKIYLETAELFAWTAVVVVISVVLENVVVKLIGKINEYRNQKSN